MAHPISDPKLKLKFIDVAGEIYRTYVYRFHEFTITGTVMMAIDENHYHRVLTNEGKAYFIPDKFLYMVWETEDGYPYFRF